MDKAKIIKKRAGRPLKFGESTRLVRVPESFIPTLSVLLTLWEKSQLETDYAKKSITERAKRMREMADFFGDSETVKKMKGI
ncbi:MAG: hypothetical protein LBL62_00410 [Planctomycetaceae bacterium]|nr:hypothetical protein [Planctomycetaceae bacterium]